MPTKVKVRVFHELRTTLGQSELELEAKTLGDVVVSLISRKNSVRELIFDSHGKIRADTTFYVNNSAQSPPDFSRKLNDGDIILLVPTAAGG
jgi:molybdopterin converting factor small subunit